MQGLPRCRKCRTATPEDARIAEVLADVAERLQDNYPYFHPLYAGQMLKPPHPVARLAYALAQWINPNNHALDGGRASSAMEKEAVSELAQDVWLERASWTFDRWRNHGQPGSALGGWAIAAGKNNSGQRAGALHAQADQRRAAACVRDRSVRCAARGWIWTRFKNGLTKDDVGTVVVTMGTTATGSVDPLRRFLRCARSHGFRVHCDAAYGGYFVLAENLAAETRRGFRADARGGFHRDRSAQARFAAVWLRLRVVSRSERRTALQTRFALHLFQFEGIAPRGDQSGMFAARCGGGGAVGHAETVAAAKEEASLHRVWSGAGKRRWSFTGELARDQRFVAGFLPGAGYRDLCSPRRQACARVAVESQEDLRSGGERGICIWLSRNFPWSSLRTTGAGATNQVRTGLTCLRSVLMKPEHKEWIGRIWEILSEATEEVLRAEGR